MACVVARRTCRICEIVFWQRMTYPPGRRRSVSRSASPTSSKPGNTAPAQVRLRRGRRSRAARKLVHLHDALRGRVAAVQDATLAEHREWLAETHGVVAGLTTIWKTLGQLGLT